MTQAVFVTSDLQVHGHHPSSEASSVSEGHSGSHRLHLESGRGSGFPSLLLLHHQSAAPQNPLLRVLAPHGLRPLHVRTLTLTTFIIIIMTELGCCFLYFSVHRLGLPSLHPAC